MIPERVGMVMEILPLISLRGWPNPPTGASNCGEGFFSFLEKMSLNPSTEVMFPSLTSASSPGGDSCSVAMTTNC